MDEAAVRRIIKMTIAELRQQELVQNATFSAYTAVSERLRKYYETGEDDAMREALGTMKDDKYFDILPAFYRDGDTVEEIAEYMEVDSRTVARNKRRLCLELYMIIS